MLRPKDRSEENHLLDQSTNSQNDGKHQMPNAPYVQPEQTYQPPHGYGHAYHPPPHYNTPPPMYAANGGGIHYSYLLLVALGFATVVQITKGGLFAHHYSEQRPQFVYPTVATNLRYPNGGVGNYYGMAGSANNPNMMINGMNMQQTQQAATTTSISNDQPAAANGEVPVSTQAAPAAPTETVAVTPTEPVGTVDTSTSPVEPAAAAVDVTTEFDLAELSNFKDNWDPWEPSDTPVFFHIPKAGGSTIKDIIGTCHRFIMATEAGITDGHDADTEIAVVYPGGGPAGQDRSPFVNVDTTTVAGISRAQQMGFADSGLADAVVTPFIYETNELFTPTAKGRLFTVFRHPIDRAISLFYYLQVADWEPTYDPDLKNWSIAEYAKSDKIENNWLTRQLSNQLGGELTDQNLQKAMEVVRRKFLVGLMTEIEPTMERCESFFRWTYHVNPTNQEKCRDALLHGGSNSNKANKKDKPQEGGEEWELLALQNNFDLQLYGYIESLFKEQTQFVADLPVDFRNIDGTCCKCDPPTFPPEGFECPKAILF